VPRWASTFHQLVSMLHLITRFRSMQGFPEGFNVSGSYNAYPDVAINVWSGCYSGSWQDDVSTLVAQNASVIVSGPFYITQQNGAPSTPHFMWDQVSADLSDSSWRHAQRFRIEVFEPAAPLSRGSMYSHYECLSACIALIYHPQMYATDLWNFTANATAAQQARVQGGLLAAWGDATRSDAADVALELFPYLFGVSEAWWSPQAWTNAAVESGGPDGLRAHAQR